MPMISEHRYKCLQYNEVKKSCQSFLTYNVNLCPLIKYRMKQLLLGGGIPACNDGVVNIDWVTNLTHRTTISNYFTKQYD